MPPMKMLSILTISLVLVSANAVTIQDCARFAAMGFDISDTPRYPEVLSEDATMILAQAGEYKGPDGIAEYVNFALAKYSPYMQTSVSVAESSMLAGFDSEKNECKFVRYSWTKYGINPKYGKDGDVIDGPSIVAIFYNPVVDKITKMIVHYDVRLLLFGSNFFFQTVCAVVLMSYA